MPRSDVQLVVVGDVALADARALDDPLVARVDDLRQVGVGHDALGQMRADAADDGSNDCHELPCLFSLTAFMRRARLDGPRRQRLAAARSLSSRRRLELVVERRRDRPQAASMSPLSAIS